MAQVKNIPILKDGKVVSYFSGDDAELARMAASLGGQPGTPTGLSPLPEGGGSVPSPYTLPGSKGETSPLLSFADSLDAAVNLARKKRNESSLNMMKPFQGTVAASDFSSILGNLNAASDKTSSALIKRATDVTTPDIITSTDESGNVHGIDKNTGNIVWTAPGVGNRQGGDTLVERNARAIAEFSDSFTLGNYLPNGIPTVDNEGFITPEAWRAAIAEAPSRGLTRAEFIKQFGYMITTQGQVSSKYGLTPVEMKLLLGSDSGVVNPFQ